MNLDIMYTHNNNVTRQVGDFHGIPIMGLDKRDMDVDRSIEHRWIIDANLQGLQAEVLPGEVVSEEDMVIRRATTAEAIGPVFYEYQQPENTMRVPIDAARSFSNGGAMVTWRPDYKVSKDEEFALLHTEEV